MEEPHHQEGNACVDDGGIPLPPTNKRKLNNTSQSSTTQKDALQTIYKSLNGPNWTRQNNWLFNDHSSCEFQGITFQGDHVKILELSQNNVKGRLDDPTLVEAFIQLGPSLEQLWMSENSLTGNLPSVFANEKIFPKLTIIDVGSNKLRGSLHPMFAQKRAVPFSYLDTSDNQLTSYYRCNDTNDDADGTNDNESGNDDWSTKTSTISSPLPHVHVCHSLLTKEQCATLINLAIHHTKTNGGWTTDRHKSYKTTDIDIAYCGNDILDVCNDHLRITILPLLSKLFHIPIVDLVIEDLFLAKYSADKGEQSMLSKHVDDSELSFVITLNDEFKGGGTCFINDDATTTVVAPSDCGGGVFFCGHRLHSGVEVVDGTRYILAGFVRVYPSTAEGKELLDCILKQTKEG